MLGQPGIELLNPLIGRLPPHGSSKVRAESVESVDIFEGLSEVLFKSPDRLEGGDIELLSSVR